WVGSEWQYVDVSYLELVPVALYTLCGGGKHKVKVPCRIGEAAICITVVHWVFFVPEHGGNSGASAVGQYGKQGAAIVHAGFSAGVHLAPPRALNGVRARPGGLAKEDVRALPLEQDRKSTRLNSSH